MKNIMVIIALPLLVLIVFATYAEASALARVPITSAVSSRAGASSLSALGRSRGQSVRLPSYSRPSGSNRASGIRSASSSRGGASSIPGLSVRNQPGRSATARTVRGYGNTRPSFSGLPRGDAGGELLDLFRTFGKHAAHGHGNMVSRGQRSSHYDDRDSMAKAYRDVGMAHALVGLVGILVDAAQNTQAPVATPIYVERQPVLVQPRRYEQYQEWIPELYDPRTGQKIGGGYYETRTRIVPEVIQYMEVPSRK